MPKRKTAERSNDERVRFTGGRAPDARAEAAGPPEPIASDPQILQSKPDPLGRCRVTVGFELVSCATPARLVRTGNAERTFTMFPGEEELESDIRVALAPFVAEMREDAALMAEYAFTPVGAGSVEVRFRLLIETPAMPLADALDEALRARRVGCLSPCPGRVVRLCTGSVSFGRSRALARQESPASRPTQVVHR